DAYGHVNNAEMLRLLEEARMQAFWRSEQPENDLPTAVLEAGPNPQVLSLIARQEIEYLAPIPYDRRPLDIELWIGRLGGASLELGYEVYSPVGVEPRRLYTRAATTLVMVSAATESPTRIPAEHRAAWQPYLETPIAFNRRG
ncbi:MAG: thioesterase family protein, partial [Rhodoglobus sp.]